MESSIGIQRGISQGTMMRILKKSQTKEAIRRRIRKEENK